MIFGRVVREQNHTSALGPPKRHCENISRKILRAKNHTSGPSYDFLGPKNQQIIQEKGHTSGPGMILLGVVRVASYDFWAGHTSRPV